MTAKKSSSVQPDGRGRAVIEGVSPEIDAGRYPIKRVIGEKVVVEADIFGDGHDALSAVLREHIYAYGSTIIYLDLAPDQTVRQLVSRLERPRGSRSLSSHLKRTIGFSGVKAGLLWEFCAREQLEVPSVLADLIKRLPIPLLAPRPLEEAISSAGGISFEALDDSLMLRKLPGVFCAGEMLDWEAPTGGYLLTACFATGRAAGKGAAAWLDRP